MVGKNIAAEQPGERVKINLSREDALLIHCARLDIPRERRQAVTNLLAEGLDWDKLIQRAGWHRLLPLVSHHLRSPLFNMFVPKPVLERMKSLYYNSLARNTVLQDELARLLSAFNEQEIPVIVLKGAALLESIYRDISLRPMSDLDILVRPEHLNQTEAIALRWDYAYLAPADIQEQTRQNCRHLANLLHHRKRIMLEIHHHIVSPDEPYHFKLEGFWARAQFFEISGASALTLAPEDLLIHLSVRFLLDRRYRSNSALGQLCDISEVIKYYGDSLDWNLLGKVARENGLTSGLHFVLYACEQLLDTPVPALVLRNFQPRDFNPASAKLFIRRRVLDIRPWLAHGLADSKLRNSQPSIFHAIVGRFSNIAAGIFKKNKLGTQSGTAGLRRVGDILPRLARVALRPSELKEDLQLDRWLHSIYNQS